MQRPHQLTGMLLLCIAIYVGIESLKLRYYTSIGPGPGFFPLWLSIILGVLALAMLGQATLGAAAPLPRDFFADRGGYVRMAVVAVSLLASALLLERIGFRLTMLAVYMVLLWGLGRRRVASNLLFAFIGSFGVYFVFVQWLSVPLPVSTFGW